MRMIKIGGAQMGPIQLAESREAVVARMIALLDQAASCGCDLVVFPELALTTFFPRYVYDDPAEYDQFYEEGLPSPAMAPLFGGPLVRDFIALHGVLLVVQAVGVVTLGFVTWFWAIGRYKASTVASFSFLTPLLSALLGWLALGETVGPVTPVALALLIAGLFLINRR